MHNEKQEGFGLDEADGSDLYDRQYDPLARPGLSKGQKIAAGVLGIAGLLVLTVWLAQFNKNIQFSNNDLNLPSACPGGVCPSSQNESLKEMDTDGDGLSDWDELYIYFTSPYLEDSDSDGISDYDEVMRGTDPNCPEGRTCGAENFLLDGEAVLEESLLDSMLADGITETEISGVEEKDLAVYQKLLSGDLTAKELREILTLGGMDAKLLEQLSDEQLMSSYKETMKNK
jgi:hypothetical protein